MIKCSRKLGIEGDFLNLIKSIYQKTTANILLHGEKLDAFHLRLRTKQECVLSQLLLRITLEGLANAIKEVNNRYLDWERRNKIIFVHRWDDIYVEKSSRNNNDKTSGTNK